VPDFWAIDRGTGTHQQSRKPPGSSVLPVTARRWVLTDNTFWHARWDYIDYFIGFTDYIDYCVDYIDYSSVYFDYIDYNRLHHLLWLHRLPLSRC
jgi:hypothetical protein